ncbi:hypothetical protein EF908_07015 [Streptomyces sp. WAC04770]|nr:hypothetical protein [Streptomyces sp. WAC04770]RST24122.1 hypothetical protein EF908_07015 [Streptomyces sp. WAC04770]
MNPCPSPDVFTRICRSVEQRYAHEQPLCSGSDTPGEPHCGRAGISLHDLRSQALRAEPGHPDRIAHWQHIAGHIRQAPEGAGGRSWTLVAVWLLAPRLRGAAYSLSRRTGAEHADVCSALLQGTLEGVRTLGRADASLAEQHLVDAAFAAGWRTGRRSPEETPVGEWGTVQEREAPDPLTIAADEVVRVGGMSRTLAQQAQGERLGSLAYRLGLLAYVRRVRQQGRRRASPRVQPSASEQLGLFGMREAAR